MASEVYVFKTAERLFRVCVNGAFYAWQTRNDNLALDLQDSCRYTVRILHNRAYKAMLDIKDAQTGALVIRQEVNPWDYAHEPEWVRDTNGGAAHP